MITGQDLTNRHVVLRQNFFSNKPYKNTDQVFLCHGGNGCNPEAMGTSVFGEFLIDNEACKVNRGDVLRFATTAEVDAALDCKTRLEREPGYVQQIRAIMPCAENETTIIFARSILQALNGLPSGCELQCIDRAKELCDEYLLMMKEAKTAATKPKKEKS